MYWCIHVVSACGLAIRSFRVWLLHHWVELLHSCLTLLPPPPNLQRFTWVYSGGHINTGNQNAEREQIIERKMKAKYILGEMILSWSDNRAGGLQGWGRPEREPRCLAPGIHRYFLSYNWKPWNAPWFVFFNKHWWALCSVWFGLLVCICINHLKNGKIEKTIKIFL